MNSGFVTVWCIFIALSRSKVNRAANLLVKQNISHSFCNIRIYPQSKLADISCTIIGIENFVYCLRIICGSIYNLAVLKLQANIFKLYPLFNRRNIVSNVTVYAIFHRCGINFAVRNISKSAAFDSRYAFYRKS